ncbi:MAG: S1 RNA-binding domain-containing protein, partial [Bacteroidota bacterium]|nr:S1 RNA-binding domain-containing protein [Bacteroidota bacterium]
MRKFLAIIAFFIFCSDFLSQIKGDSVHVETAYSKKYQGTVTQIDKEGFFIKISNNRDVYIPKLEIKTLFVVPKEVEIGAHAETHISSINSTDAKTKASKNQTEVSDFYKKYELHNLDISSFHSLKNPIIRGSFVRKINKHILSNPTLTLREKLKFNKNMKIELEKESKVAFSKYKKSMRTCIVTGVLGASSFIAGSTILNNNINALVEGFGLVGASIGLFTFSA